MKFSLLIPVFIIVFGNNVSYSQRTCGAMEVLEEQKKEDPTLEIRMQQIEEATKRFLRNNPYRAVVGVITIPIVIHVVYENATENISDAQILSQIQILNEDFRRMNSDADNIWSQAADAEIEFCLATIDPNGNSTSGITRTLTTVTVFGLNDEVKSVTTGGVAAWPAADYLNIWVCDITTGFLGYAQFPGGAAATDGVVCDYQYFGNIGTAIAPFDLGRTMTHEVGHYLNLIHIWGDGPCNQDDQVSDTPPARTENYTESPCTFPGPNTCNMDNDPDMFQNYMDYSDDVCMNLFTEGQKSRMQAIFDTGGWRESLVTSSKCGIPVYTFEGPGNDWYTGSDWHNGEVPAIGFEGIIIINADCIKQGPTEVLGELTIKSGVTFIQN